MVPNVKLVTRNINAEHYTTMAKVADEPQQGWKVKGALGHVDLPSGTRLFENRQSVMIK